MKPKKEPSENKPQIFDVAAAVAEMIRELEEGREELMRKDAEINRLIDEAWKKGGE